MLLTVEGISVEVVRKDIKNMYLRVYPPDGRVVVSAPRAMGDAAIKSFLMSKLAWIRMQQTKALAKQEAQGNSEHDALLVWGERYRLSVKEEARFDLRLSGDEAILTVRAGASDEEREAYLIEWYRAELCREIERLMPLWESRMGLKCAEWRTKNMKTRWGTCNVKKRRIWLNVQLAKYPVKCLEYVIVHELAHLVEASHGPKFKAEMDKYLPEWRNIRKELNSMAS